MIAIQLPETVNYFVAKFKQGCFYAGGAHGCAERSWKYPRYSLRFACMDAGKEREQERKSYASYLTVLETGLLNQDLFTGSVYTLLAQQIRE